MKKVIKYSILIGMLIILSACYSSQANTKAEPELFRPKTCVPLEEIGDPLISRCLIVQDST